MDRRQFITTTGTAAGIGLAGCVNSNADTESDSDGEGDGGDNSSNDTGDGTGDEGEEPEPEPEPEGGDGTPYTHYDLDVIEEREEGKPLWVDNDERVYGRDGPRVIVSDDWYETTDVLYEFSEEKDGETRSVEMVIVPDSGRIVVGVGGKGARGEPAGGTVYLLDEDLSGSTEIYDFDYGYVSNSMGHAAYEEIVVICCYQLSDFADERHGNEVILSTDGGETFERILEVPMNTADAANNHTHDVEYDPYAERIWVIVGDHGNSQIYWSDDLGETWSELTERGGVTMITQCAAFKDCVAFGTDGVPEGIILWERDGEDDEPSGADELIRPHVQIETDPDDDTMEMYARRRWHIRDDLEAGRELCLMPFGYSTMHDTAEDSVVLASVDGYDWYELHRTETRDILLTNVMGPLSMDGERKTLVSDSNQGDGYNIEATVPAFWDRNDQ